MINNSADATPLNSRKETTQGMQHRVRPAGGDPNRPSTTARVDAAPPSSEDPPTRSERAHHRLEERPDNHKHIVTSMRSALRHGSDKANTTPPG